MNHNHAPERGRKREAVKGHSDLGDLAKANRTAAGLNPPTASLNVTTSSTRTPSTAASTIWATSAVMVWWTFS